MNDGRSSVTKDLHDVLADVARHLNRDDVDILKCYLDIDLDLFQNNSSEAYGCSFFRAVEERGVIREGDVTCLIDAFKNVGLAYLAKQLEHYQNTCSCEDVFVGRELDINKMQFHIEYCRSSSKFPCLFISGISGVGKTSLVKELWRRQSSDGVKMEFVSCHGYSSAISIQEAVLKLFFIESEDQDCYKRLRQKLKSVVPRINYFIVLDNVDDVMKSDEKNFNSFLCNLIEMFKKVENVNNCLVLTSGERLSYSAATSLDNDVLLCENLDVMNESDSYKLITHCLKERVLQLEEKKRLMKLCRQHPLSMILITNHLTCFHSVPFTVIEDGLKEVDVSSLNVDIVPAEISTSITKIFFLVFNSLHETTQDLLVRLSHASVDIKDSTVKRLFWSRTPDSQNGQFQAVRQLIDRNLVTKRTSGYERSDHKCRYSMHTLIKKIISIFCESADCPLRLKQAYDESRECLLNDYPKQMIELSKREISGCLQQSEILSERGNFLSKLSEVVDHLIIRSADPCVFEGLSNFRYHLMSNRQAMANFYLEQKKVAKMRCAPSWVVAYFTLSYADVIRLAGNAEQAKRNFVEVESLLHTGKHLSTKREWRWLTAQYHRYYGRYLKDLPDQRHLTDAICHFEKAKQEFSAQDSSSVFSDPSFSLAELCYDMGNTYRLLADEKPGRRTKNLRLAKSSFEEVRKIYEKRNPLTVSLFEVYLSLAAVEMNLKSVQLSATDIDHTMIMKTMLDYCQGAERIARMNEELVQNNDLRMGDLYFWRACCYERARKYSEALVDIETAVKLRETVYGCHTKTMSALIIYGYVALSDPKDVNHRTAFTVLDRAFNMAKRLARKGNVINMMDLENMENYMLMACDRLNEHFDKYERIVEAIKTKDVNALISDSSDEECSSEDGEREISLDYAERQFSDSNDDDTSVVPSIDKAKDLGDQIETIMSKKAENLDCLATHWSRDDMMLEVRRLRNGYRNMDNKKRIEIFDYGTNLLWILKTIDDYPQKKAIPHQILVCISLVVLLFALLLCVLF